MNKGFWQVIGLVVCIVSIFLVYIAGITYMFLEDNGYLQKRKFKDYKVRAVTDFFDKKKEHAHPIPNHKGKEQYGIRWEHMEEHWEEIQKKTNHSVDPHTHSHND